MDRTNLTLEGVTRTVAYLALGLVGTLAVALALMRSTVFVQSLLYELLYLRLGPSEATEAAVLLHFLGICVVAAAVPLFVADYLSSDLANRDALLSALAALVGLLVVFLVVALLGFAAAPVAFLLLLLVLLAIPLLLRYRFDVESGAVPAFVGGIPVLVLLVLLVAFGLGWGWGYVVSAHEVPDDAVQGEPVGDLSDAPTVESALFAAGNCETDADGFQACYLSLRGFEHERAAVRSLDDLGVRCPYQGTPDGGTVVLQHDGRYYEVRCAPHGD